VTSKGDGNTEGLVRGVQAGDADGFAAVVDRMRGRLEMWIRVRMGPLLRARLTVDDVLQETLIQAYRSLDAFRDTGPGSFQRWMFSVAENRLKDLHKYHAAQKRHPAREANPTPEEQRIVDRLAGDGTTPSQGFRRSEVAARIADGLAKVPEGSREIIVLRVVEDLSFAEVAERIGTDARAARGLYARALKDLQRALTGGMSLT
jgi:RNA polymerase sigma-70 factor (ECF subfamily)